MKTYFENKTIHIALTAAFAFGSAFVASSSYAATATANMPVTASVTAACTISAGTLAFGAYDPIVTNKTTNLDGTATLTTTCTTGSSPTIALDQGVTPTGGSTAAAPARQLLSGTNKLAYSLYSDSGRLTVWGSTGVATPTATGTAQTNTVYGAITSGQNPPTGAYTDTVVATVSF